MHVLGMKTFGALVRIDSSGDSRLMESVDCMKNTERCQLHLLTFSALSAFTNSVFVMLFW